MIVIVTPLVIEDDGKWVSGVGVVIDGNSYFYAHDVSTHSLDIAEKGAINMCAAVEWGIRRGAVEMDSYIMRGLKDRGVL